MTERTNSWIQVAISLMTLALIFWFLWREDVRSRQRDADSAEYRNMILRDLRKGDVPE